MTRRFWLLIAVGSVALFGAVVATGATTAVTMLVVADDDGTERLAIPAEADSEVTIEYSHSVEQTLVSDVYVVSDGALVMDRMLFSSYGAGLPSEAPVIRDGDRYVYHPPEQRHETLTISTGPVAEQVLIVAGEEYDLFALADGGTIHLSVENRTQLHPGR